MKPSIQTFAAAVCVALLSYSPVAANPAASDKTLKVYILAGQSNMQGQAGWWVTRGLADDPSTRHLHEKFVDADGNFREEKNVYVAALSGEQDAVEKNGPLTVGFGGALGGDLRQKGRHGMRWGPEWGFGVTMGEHLNNPVLIIKTSWGGKSLSTDFRSPSAGPYEYRENILQGQMQRRNLTKEEVIAAKNAETGVYYRMMLDHVRKVLANPSAYHPAYDPAAGYEISGFVWLQGWNDMVDSHTYAENLGENRYDLYRDLLAHFIRDVRKDFKAPKMPFVIGVLGMQGYDVFRAAMAAPAKMEEFKGNVIAVDMLDYVDEKLIELYVRRNGWHERADKENKFAELREKLAPLRQELEEAKKIEDQRERGRKEAEIQERMRAIIFTPEELEYLDKNHSSQGFHYQGSPKFFGRVGEAFAKALLEHNKKE